MTDTTNDPNLEVPSGQPEPSKGAFSMMVTPSFPQWLVEQFCSLAFTTYENGKLFVLGLSPEGRLSVFERTFKRSMGLFVRDQSVYLASKHQVWHLENVTPDEKEGLHGYDACYVPTVSYNTGDIDTHDLVVDAKGRILFISTLFNCMATVSEYESFTPLWYPSFVNELVPEDRCHLNGLAIVDGEAKYVTAVSKSNEREGWRQQRVDGGVVIDITTNKIIAQGLSMPHSPRWYNDKLWLLNSGTGELGYLEKKGLKKFEFVPLTFCPGYPRGLTFHNNYAIVGISTPRYNETFHDLPLDEKLQASSDEGHCGVLVINLSTGEIEHELQISGSAQELYDVAVIPGVIRPMLIGVLNDEVERMVFVENKLYLAEEPDEEGE